MKNSIFETASMSTDWESYMNKLTPWEEHDGVMFKREDFYAPLSYSGPNGSKLRQLQHLFQRYRGNATHVLTGASVLSPQHSMTAILASYYGLPSRHVVGATTHAAMVRNPNVEVAKGFGAHFEIIPVAFNPALQREVKRLTRDDSFVVPYGITRCHKTYPAEQIYDFHEVGARQVENLPDNVKTLIVPSGSCNTLVSILLGLSRDSRNLETLYAVGIGPDRREWVRERLSVMGVDYSKFQFKWREHSLHEAGVKYTDKVKASYGGVVGHPSYEGKVLRHLKEHDALQPGKGIGFWIVGSEPSVDVIRPFFIQQPEEAFA